ncbi:MAG: hypothetical protein ABJE95_19615 [Byssovorax sp.]
MADEGTETLTIRLEDESTDAANRAAPALERLAAAQDAQAKAGIGGVAGEKQATAFKRLREMGTQAGSALAAAMAGVQVQMGGAVTSTNRLISALQLAKNRARERDAAAARQLAEDMTRANRLPSHLAAPPPAAFTAERAAAEAAAAIATASQAAGSAQRAAATDALSFAVAAAEAATSGRQLASVYDLVANRAAEAASADARKLTEDMNRANRMPTALQSSPKAIDWDAALAAESQKSGSAARAAANDVLGLATSAAAAVTNAQKLSSVYDLVAKRAAAAAKTEEKAFAAAVEAANKVPKSLQPKAAAPEFSAFQKTIKDIESLFGKRAAGGAVDAAQGLAKLAENYEKLGPIGQGLIKGAGAITLAAAAMAAAAAVLIGKALFKVASMAIEQGEAKKAAVSALSRLSGGAGDEVYQTTIKLAADFNLDKDETIAKVKTLLQAGIGKDQIPLAIQAIADVSVALGDEKGHALEEKLATLGRGKKINEDAIRGLAEAGVDANAVFENLKKKGESTAQVMARLKTGQVQSAEAIKAVLAAVESTSGGMAAKAGQSISGLANAIQLKVLDLFTDIDTGPLKDLLATIKKLFDAPEGAALKKEITGLGNAIFDLLRPLSSAEGKKKLAEGFVSAAAAAHDLATIVKALGDGLKVADDAGGLSALLAVVNMLLGPLKEAADFVRVIKSLSGDKTDPPKLDTGSMSADAAAGGQAAGENLASGFTRGILSGTAAAVSAAIDMARKALDGVASPAGQDSHSPSRKAGKLGGHFGQGYAIAIKGSGSAANDAGAALAMRAVGGTAKQQGANDLGDIAPAGGAGAGAGGGVVFNITVTGGGTPEQNQKTGQEIGDAAYAAWRKHNTRNARDTVRKAG